MTQSQKMRKTLEKCVIENLKSYGFDGVYPNYKKVLRDRIEQLKIPIKRILKK